MFLFVLFCRKVVDLSTQAVFRYRKLCDFTHSLVPIVPHRSLLFLENFDRKPGGNEMWQQEGFTSQELVCLCSQAKPSLPALSAWTSSLPPCPGLLASCRRSTARDGRGPRGITRRCWESGTSRGRGGVAASVKACQQHNWPSCDYKLRMTGGRPLVPVTQMQRRRERRTFLTNEAVYNPAMGTWLDEQATLAPADLTLWNRNSSADPHRKYSNTRCWRLEKDEHGYKYKSQPDTN